MKAVAILTFAIIAARMSAYCQVTELPKPTGDYPVGTRYLLFTDNKRLEIFTRDTTDFREITAKVWYPGEPKASTEPAAYLMKAEEVVSVFKLPPSLTEMRTHSKLNLPVSQLSEAFPVLIFNHGWGEHFSQNTVLMEELASHGYIIFSIAHHYEAKFSFYPDGQIITLDPSSERFQKMMKEQSNPKAVAIFQRMVLAKTREEQESIFRETNELLPTMLVEGSRIWANDIRFIIDQLEELNRSDVMFQSKLNMKQVGVFGMSMGGIASGLACQKDKRCKVGISMDGGLYGDLLASRIPVPFMFMNSERYRGYDELFLSHVDNSGYNITVEKADHYNFSDLSILSPAAPMIGEIDGYRMLSILNDYTRAFFDKHLRGIDSTLLGGSLSDYQEVRLTVKRPEK